MPNSFLFCEPLAQGRRERCFGLVGNLHNFCPESLCNLPIDFSPEMWYNVSIKEREVITMVGALIMIGLCYLGLLACGIMLFIDTLEAKKFAKKTQKFWENFWKTP